MKRFYTCVFLLILVITQGYSQINWTKHPDKPVLQRGANGTWDEVLIAGLYTIFDGVKYHGWYGGNGDSGTQIGYVSSADGINWTKYADPVLLNGPDSEWDNFVVYQPSVLFDGDMYHMWFGGHNGNNNRQIGYATSPDSINWTKYESNPVLKPGPAGSWDDLWADSPFVFKIDSVYHMWYSGSDGSVIQSGHATSPDGISWQKDLLNPVLKSGEIGDWDAEGIYQPSVLTDKDGKYHMFYSGGSSFKWKMGYASSLDGRHWTKYPEPVMKPGLSGSWDDTFTGLATVAFNEDSTVFQIWYTGNNSTSISGWDIGYATSPLEPAVFENTWFKFHNNPVFEGVAGEFDSQHIAWPDIVFHENQYHMWYSGYDGGAGSKVGFAVSDDCIKWDRHDGPVLKPGSGDVWDNYSVQQPSVLFDGTTWHMWYLGLMDGDLSTRHIGYATSTDKINWKKHESNPVLGPGPEGSWDDEWIGWPRVLFIEGQYHMWYTAGNGTLTRIGHATSQNGIDWEKDPINPVLTVGTSGAWDDLTVSNPDLIYDGHTFQMWYCGARTAFGDWKVGYAVSPDGRNWQKISVENPVLDLGPTGAWDDKTSAAGVIVIPDPDSDALRMWYGGGGSSKSFRIGLSSSELFDMEPPAAPTGVKAFFSSADSVVTISWHKNKEEDLKYYTVYRKHLDSQFDNVTQVSDTFYVDSDPVDESTYAVSATDILGNEGIQSEIVTVTSLNQSMEAPLKFSLSQNYPNPFNPTTKINYQLAKNSDVNFSVYNMLGQKVATLINKKHTAGQYAVEWDASSFSSGVYLYRLQAGNHVQTRKMILMK